MPQQIDNTRISSIRPLISPAVLLEELPLPATTATTIQQARQAASDIIKGKDDRLIVVVGPCSIHDVEAAIEYGTLLKQAQQEYQADLHIIMRMYFEKPRTTVGWKGLINDPSLDGTFNINNGLKVARKLLLDFNKMGVPCGTEFLDTIVPQFISDLISWGAIGARTTESQIHRELASGLSMPVGFKNGTDGNVQIAVDAISSALNPHHFLGVTKDGASGIVSTTGNDDCHVILRGANTFTNYDALSVNNVATMLHAEQMNHRVMIDCSHGNSAKDYRRQRKVACSICQELSSGSTLVCGLMLESNLIAGKQSLQAGKPPVYGQSITDACIAWPETLEIFNKLAHAVRKRRASERRKTA